MAKIESKLDQTRNNIKQNTTYKNKESAEN